MAENNKSIKKNTDQKFGDKLKRENKKKERLKALKRYYGTVNTDFMENTSDSES